MRDVKVRIRLFRVLSTQGFWKEDPKIDKLRYLIREIGKYRLKKTQANHQHLLTNLSKA